MPTYAEALTQRLRNLRNVALFNPGLAYIGIDAELENLFREVVPPTLLRVWAIRFAVSCDAYDRLPEREQKDLITRAIRNERKDWSYRDLFQESIDQFLRTLPTLAGDARHGRTKLVFDEVNQDIENAVQLVEGVATVYRNVLICKKDGAKTDFEMWRVLRCELGETIRLECSQCCDELDSYRLPVAFDAAPYRDDDLDTLAAAAKLLADELLSVRGRQYAEDGITDDEFVECRDCLTGIVK